MDWNATAEILGVILGVALATFVRTHGDQCRTPEPDNVGDE
jgi:hypothetical protein